MATIDAINRLLRQPRGVENNPTGIAKAIQQFLGVNRDPENSPNRLNEAEDDMAAIFVTLSLECLRHNALLMMILKVLKVLLRKQVNRRAMGRPGVLAVTNLLKSPCLAIAVCECANVVLNMCYDKANVEHFLQVDGIDALVPLINSQDESIQASGLGALQSVCFEKPGREAAREVSIIGPVVRLLQSGSQKVQARALGTIHNLSTDAQAIGPIREEGGIPPLVGMLRHPEPQICGGAAGTIQNLSREARSREVLGSLGVVAPLSDLLVGHHIRSQISAAGALVNIMSDARGKQRDLLHSVLADGIVLGVLQSCMH
ncbi:unnamed protein product [Discosporangium mesarthrocarpum]